MAPLVPTGPGPMGQEQAGSLTGHWAGRVLMTASFTPKKTPCSLPQRRPTSDTSARSQREGDCWDAALCLWLSLIRQTVCTVRSKGVVLVEADSTDHWSSPRWRTGDWAGICSGLPSLSIHRRKPCVRIAAATRHASGPVQRRLFHLEVCALPPREWPGPGHLQRGGC